MDPERSTRLSLAIRINTNTLRTSHDDHGYLVFGQGLLGEGDLEPALTVYYALIDSDTPLWAKGFIVGALGYFVTPFDAFPT